MIKFKKINIKKVSALLLSGIILISIFGCSNKKENYQDNSNSTYSGRIHKSEKENNKTEESSDNITKTESKEQSSNNQKKDYQVSDNNSSEEFNQTKNKDQLVIDFLEQIDDKITKKSYQAKDELIKDYGIIHDFIFEEGTIKGYTFDELKDNTKAKVLSIYLQIDEKIEKNFPKYKEIIKEKYGNIKEKLKNKISQYKNDFIDYLKNEIGNEKYNSIIETKDKYVEEFKEQTKSDIDELKELGGKAKEKVKNWFNKN